MKKHHENTVTLPISLIPELLQMPHDEKLQRLIDLLTICDAKEIAKVLGVTQSHIWYLADSNQIPCMYIADKKLFNKGDVLKALEQRKNSKKPGIRHSRRQSRT